MGSSLTKGVTLTPHSLRGQGAGFEVMNAK